MTSTRILPLGLRGGVGCAVCSWGVSATMVVLEAIDSVSLQFPVVMGLGVAGRLLLLVSARRAERKPDPGRGASKRESRLGRHYRGKRKRRCWQAWERLLAGTAASVPALRTAVPFMMKGANALAGG